MGDNGHIRMRHDDQPPAGRSDGIVCTDAEKTLQNLGSLGNEGMQGANDLILNMMLDNAGAGGDVTA